ncbi:uncharacterized protein LOC108744126 isoform X2 [Agrilus planipennis]|uniref:Uncharacterized protein LOC108744126 isoform X2 n=1 Tax=Agrilus planipennis TaxID=224129 RepID=A0A1W4XR30_AGRPL|nr:uncharacterized protein LOC108744126 isoform X2 [Agrilus planipennis]
MKQFLNMESLRITSILVLLYTCSVSSFPSRPLNERSADLAWQAWLLVDDQNQEKNYGAEALGRRRITPKSVFIAPTFSPESLPPCASGYQSDSMGRCVKLIEIDQEAHLDFLLQKLNERFGYEEYSREEDDEKSPSGPVQLNIPLDETPTGVESELEKFEENIDVAIVVTPTNGRFSFDGDDENDDIKKNRKKSGEEFNDMKNKFKSRRPHHKIRKFSAYT